MNDDDRIVITLDGEDIMMPLKDILNKQKKGLFDRVKSLVKKFVTINVVKEIADSREFKQAVCDKMFEALGLVEWAPRNSEGLTFHVCEVTPLNMVDGFWSFMVTLNSPQILEPLRLPFTDFLIEYVPLGYVKTREYHA